jgi:hypothetical protein
VIENGFAVGVEDMRAILVNENAGLVVSIVGIAADMRPAIDHQDLFVTLARQPFGNNAPGETGTDDEPIKHEPFQSRIAR